MNSENREAPEHVHAPRHSYALTFALCTILGVLMLLTITLYVSVIANQPPLPFPTDTTVTIEPGSSVDGIAHTLANAGVIRSPFLFKLLTAVDGRSASLKAGTYRFSEPLSTAGVMRALIEGTHIKTDIIVTIPEGTRSSEIARIVSDAVPSIDRALLEELAVPREGYLFPETYHLSPTMTEEEVIDLLTTTFNERMPRISEERGRTQSEIVTMASILEREGNSSENMGLIAGILWKRLEIGMPLQVDASLEYERGLGSSELSFADLEEDSPFNTYTRRGLPPTPISNPGLVALVAAIEPTPSPYLYYLTGDDGVFYYAETFDEHKENKERYLSW
jgi:UPF0755 protein